MSRAVAGLAVTGRSIGMAFYNSINAIQGQQVHPVLEISSALTGYWG